MSCWIIALSLAVAAGDAPASWPQFRGSNAAGVAADGVAYPVRFGPDRYLWEADLGSTGQSSPCVWADRIFITGYDAGTKSLSTIALDRRTGNIVWQRKAPAPAIEKVHENGSPATGTPATDGERVYVFFGSFGLLCYDFDGKDLWKMPLPMPRTGFGTGTSPVVAGDLVLLSTDYQPQPTLFALDRRAGAIVWKKELPRGREGYATPVVWHHDGVDEVIIHTMQRVAAYSLKDGAERWWVGVMSNACATPVVAKDRLFASTWMVGGEESDRVPIPSFDEMLKKYDKDGDGMISKSEFPDDLSILKRVDAGDLPGADVKFKMFFDQLDMNKDGKISRIEWAMVAMFSKQVIEHGLFAIKPGGEGNVSKTHVVWREKKAAPEVPSPLYYRGRIYQVRDGGIVSCLDAETGKLIYRERLGAAGAYFSSPVAGDGKIYAASLKGTVTVFAAGDKFDVLARNDLKEPISATPALVDGIIYVRTERHLFAFRGPASQ
jgi:outer membrane protein assembly factor BamB